MSRHTVVFAGDTTKNFVPNSRRGPEYNATIHNLTDQTITITVTNDDIQGASPTFDTPDAGALAITAGSTGSLSQAYDGWLLTAGAAATGNVLITEAG